MHVYKHANFRLHVDRKWLVKMLATCSSHCYKWPSYIRGYCKYKSAWLPTVVRETPRLTTERTNPQDPFAMAVIKYGCVVGNISRTVSQTVSFFLGKYGSVCFCRVIGAMVNHTTGFGQEIPCIYWFYGHPAYIETLKNLLL